MVKETHAFLEFFYFITLAIDMKVYEICPSLTTLAHSYYSLSPWWADGLNPPPHTHTHTHIHTHPHTHTHTHTHTQTHTYLKTFSIQYRPNEIRDKHKNKPMRESCLFRRLQKIHVLSTFINRLIFDSKK